MRVFDPRAIAHAEARGIAADELPLICDGCSGGLSWAYAIMGRRISCEACCDIHDIDYKLGGAAADRKDADKRLRLCAGQAGGWRAARAWVMWAAVRIGGRWYWAG